MTADRADRRSQANRNQWHPRGLHFYLHELDGGSHPRSKKMSRSQKVSGTFFDEECSLFGRRELLEFIFTVQVRAERVGVHRTGGLPDDVELAIGLNRSNVDRLPGVMVDRIHHLGSAGRI